MSNVNSQAIAHTGLCSISRPADIGRPGGRVTVEVSCRQRAVAVRTAHLGTAVRGQIVVADTGDQPADRPRSVSRFTARQGQGQARIERQGIQQGEDLRRHQAGELESTLEMAWNGAAAAAPGVAGRAHPTTHRRADPRRPPANTPREAVTILVVDDEPRMRRLARRMLCELGYQVSEAQDAAAATRLLEQDCDVDLLFTDVVMPGEIDGRALGSWARQHRPGLKVLLTSGYMDPTSASGLADNEALPFLRKPYSKEQLRVALRRLLSA